MITCNLTKLETAFEQVRKAYPKLNPTDAALLASALTLTGRHAIAIYDSNQYSWPDDYDGLTSAMVKQLEMVNEGIETTKKSKASAEEEPVVVTLGLMTNVSAGEKQLSDRKDLKALLGDAIQEGVEFMYSPMDIGWQWALDRVNWSTISGGDVSRRIKVKASFTEGAVGIEMGASGPKRRATKKATAEVAAEAAVQVEVDTSTPEEAASEE